MVSRFIVVVLAFAALAAAQVPAKSNRAPHDVNLCNLIRHPKSYDGQMIRVRGHDVFQFEAFLLDSSGCGSDFASPKASEKGVWLTFSGDEPEIATFCCGSYRRTKGSDFEVAGHKVGLVRDAEFSAFLHQLKAHRLRRPDGKPCFDECRLYEVTATLTALFARASEEGGYGHFGMFHLLAIQKVAQVRSERRPVPFGGTFDCRSETWEPKGEEAAPLAESLGCTKSGKNDCTPSVRFRRAAAHWNDDAVLRLKCTQMWMAL